MTMDPDDLTFWFTSDYFSSNNQWRTQVASLKINPGFTDDVGINNIIEPSSGVLTSSESVQVSIRNYGSAPKSNIPLELRLDGNLVANETFTGTILQMILRSTPLLKLWIYLIPVSHILLR